MLSDSCLCRDQAQMDRGPEALGLKDTQLLTLQETGGLGSSSQIHTFLPNPPSAPFLVWAHNTQKVYGKGAGEKPCVGYLVLSLGFNQQIFLLFSSYMVTGNLQRDK